MIRWSIHGPLSVLAGLSLLAGTVRAQQTYCSPDNTGSDYPMDYFPYQSNGHCRDLCRPDGYAFAVVQYTSCWCTNFVPADQSDVGNCNADCPGFPTEDCGNLDNGLYGYLAIGPPASGTVGAGDSSEPTTPVVSTSIRTTLSNNTPVTEFIIITATPAPGPPGTSPSGNGNGNAGGDGGGSGASAGTIAGSVVGGVVGLGAVAGAVFLLLRRRRAKAEEGDGEGSDSGVRRNISTMSKTGLLRSRAEKEPTLPNVVVPGSAHGQESHYSGDQSMVSGSARRNSQRWDQVIPMPVDQRMNPNVLAVEDSRRRNSEGSFRDDLDYSRTLNVRNPDPE